VNKAKSYRFTCHTWLTKTQRNPIAKLFQRLPSVSNENGDERSTNFKIQTLTQNFEENNEYLAK
jgi:hypothetical protein